MRLLYVLIAYLLAPLVYGVMLVLFIIFLPKGILGSLIERFTAKR